MARGIRPGAGHGALRRLCPCVLLLPPTTRRDGQYVSRSAFVDLDRRDLFRVLRVANSRCSRSAVWANSTNSARIRSRSSRHGERLCAWYGGWTRCLSVPFNVAIGMRRAPTGHVRKAGSWPGPALTLVEPSCSAARRSGASRIAGTCSTSRAASGSRRRPGGAGLPDPHGCFRGRHHWTSTAATSSKPGGDGRVPGEPRRHHANGKYHMFFCYRYSLVIAAAARLPDRLRSRRPRRLDARRLARRHRRLGGRLGLGDDQLPARVRARRQDVHVLPRQPGRPPRFRARRARGRAQGRR